MAARALPALARPIRQLQGLSKPNFNEIRDVSEVNIMRAWLLAVAAGGFYSISQQLMSSRSGSFFNVNTRGDIFKQMAVLEQAAAREGRTSAGSGFTSSTHAADKHTWWWRLARVMG